jgi:hypothetical protein
VLRAEVAVAEPAIPDDPLGGRLAFLERAARLYRHVGGFLVSSLSPAFWVLSVSETLNLCSLGKGRLARVKCGGQRCKVDDILSPFFARGNSLNSIS